MSVAEKSERDTFAHAERTLRPRVARDLLLAPVAVAIDQNLAYLRVLTPGELARQFDEPDGPMTREVRAERVRERALRLVNTHNWSAEITDDGARLRLTGGSVTLDIGLGRALMDYIQGEG